MILLIGGASHTGKTLLARRLVERTGFSCLSLDLLKMGLIRSGFTALTPEDDEALTGLLWPIAREMIRTALENGQDLIVEGVYIPPAWRDGFRPEELAQIRCRFLVMTEDYIRHHFADIRGWASVVEKRLDDSGCTLEGVLEDNRSCLARCHRCDLLLIDGEYAVDWAPEGLLKENERS